MKVVRFSTLINGIRSLEVRIEAGLLVTKEERLEDLGIMEDKNKEVTFSSKLVCLISILLMGWQGSHLLEVEGIIEESICLQEMGWNDKDIKLM